MHLMLFRTLLALHRMATLHHDELGQVVLISLSSLNFLNIIKFIRINFSIQETLLNLLLRNYLHYNLYDQAEKLRSKAPRFEAHSNQQVINELACLMFCHIVISCTLNDICLGNLMDLDFDM